MRYLRFWEAKKSPLSLVYSDDYWMIDVGQHVFPVKKYRAVYERLLLSGIKKENIHLPEPATDEELLLVHTPRYIEKLKTGSLTPTEIAALELPFSPELIQFAWLVVGGTIITARLALEQGLAVHIGGGFHHAFPDHGEGFCVLNDIAVAAEKMRQEGRMKRAMIVDCDVHQGNGTAFIFAGKDDTFTFSIHQMDIYPAEKPASSLDVELWSGDGDVEYLSALRNNFPRLFFEFRPDLVFYLAGADPYKRDKLGNLRLTKEGLRERDKIVINGARALRIPVAVVLAGGYSFEFEETVTIHLNTIRVAQKAREKYL
ncbi:MAG: histone deacetylase [Clostridiales bacterium]|nr:histone deacetylase [Clostridiales bacterium]